MAWVRLRPLWLGRTLAVSCAVFADSEWLSTNDHEFGISEREPVARFAAKIPEHFPDHEPDPGERRRNGNENYCCVEQ